MECDKLQNAKAWISYCHCLQFSQGVVKKTLLVFFDNQTFVSEINVIQSKKPFLKFFFEHNNVT